MKLRKPCEEHGTHYDPQHILNDNNEIIRTWCPGGVFLPDDTLVIEKVDVDDPECGDCDHLPRREWPEAIERIGLITTDPRWSHVESPLLLEFALTVLDALSVREAE